MHWRSVISSGIALGVVVGAVLLFSQPPPNAQRALKLGNHYFNIDGQGKYDLDLAQKYYEKALELDPNVPDAWHQLARIDFLRGNFSPALEKINKQIELHGDSLMASYYIRALIEGYQKNYVDSEKDFQKFLTWDPNNWAANNDLAWVYFSEGKYQKAADQVASALTYSPDNPWLLLTYGAALLNLNKRVEAKEAFLKAKSQAQMLSADAWSHAYPGNDPKIAVTGLGEMKKAIEANLALVEN